MTLGYALLHPRQIDAALVVKPEKKGFDLMVDMLCGALGIRGVDAELEAAFTAQGAAMADFAARFETLFEPGRPLAQFKLIGAFDISDPDAIVGVFNTLCDFLETADSAQVKALAIPVIDAVLEVLPNLETEVVARFSTRQLDEVIGILKAPLRQGRKDVAAIKAYRAAMQLRCLLDPAYQKLDALGRVDLKAELRAVLIALLDGLDGMDFAPLRTLVANLKGEFGGLMRATLSCAGGGSVSAGVNAMPDASLTIFDEIRAAPHTPDKEPALWWLDLVTNSLNFFNLIWEIIRTRPFKDREADGAFLIIGVLWHGVRTVLRATIPETISRPPQGDESNAGQEFVNWLFSDWGDTAIHLFLRLLVTLIYEAPDAPENWALMLAARWLLYFVNTFNFRIWYQFARSLWYFDKFKNLQEFLDASEITQDIDLERMPLGRMMAGILGPIWFVMSITGSAMPWDEFEVENWGWHYGVMAGIPAGLWVLSHFWVSAAAGTGTFGSITKAALPDAALWITSFIGILIMAIALSIAVSGLESDARALAMTFLILIPALLGALMITMGIWWLAGSNSITQASGGLAFFSQSFSFLGITVMGLLCAVLWWFTIDDGRDARGDYDGLDVDATPYRLPFPADENWFCGQSFHGVFSHLLSSASNHFGVDMNEAPGKPGSAARTGIVTSVTQGNPDDENVQNVAVLMHTDWVENIDPGSDDERVLTYSNYVHMKENGVHAKTGNCVPRGMHLVDIDSTGRSAQHHIHYSGQTAQNGGDREGLPFIFGDQSLREFRNYPPLAIFPTRHPIPGKPLSFAFYISDNDPAEPVPHALTLSTGAANVTIGAASLPHSHRFVIDHRLLDGATIPASLTLTSTVAAGHFHTVTLSRAQLLDVFRMDAPGGVSTDEAFGHTHSVGGPLLFEWVSFNTDEIGIKHDGDDVDNEHSFRLGLDYLARNPVSAGGLTRTTSTNWSHNHDITLDAVQVATGLALGNPGGTTTGEQNVSAGRTVSAHTHGMIRCTGVSAESRDMATRVVEPPAGQLTARNPGPYALLGDRMVVRVNDRATEWHFWGGARGRVEADIAMDYGLGPGDQIRIGLGGTTVPMPTSTAPRASLQDSATALSVALRTPPAATPRAAPPRRVALRADPVLVVETLQRGSTARIERTGGTLPHALLPDNAVTIATGSGAFADLGAVPRADFLSHVTQVVQNGWATAPGPVAATMMSEQLSLSVAGGPADFTGSASRIVQVATPYYDTATRRFHGTGPLPLGPGRLALAPGFDLPLLATPAQVTLPHPGADQVLHLTVNGATDPVSVPTLADAARTARAIQQQVEGLRARASGSDLVIETISAGSGARLDVAVGGNTPVSATGTTPAGLGFGDLTRLPGADLAAIISDATNRATPPPLASSHNLRIAPTANRLRIDVDAPATVAATVFVTGGIDPIGPITTQAGGQRARSGVLPATLAFSGPAWIDIAITDGGTTETLRVPLDGEPARLDILPQRLPAGTETLTLDVNGTAVPVTFDGSERSVADMAEKIAAQNAALNLRLAYRMTVEESLWGDRGGDLRLEDTAAASDGLALAGFLGPRPLAPSGQMARGEDMLAQGAIFPAPERRAGALVDIVSFRRVGGAGGSRMRFTGSGAAARIVVAVAPGADPLNFTGGATSEILQSDSLGPETDLGATVIQYHFTASDTNGHDVAHGFTQLCAQPAIARTVNEPSLPIAGPALLDITVTEPDDTIRPARVDLSGLTTLDDAARRINAACPQVRAWVARVSEAPHAESTRATFNGNDTRNFDERLHIETIGGGTGWSLSLGDPQTAAALGFALPADPVQPIVVSGRGNIRDGARAQRDEIAAALSEAAESMTGSTNPAGMGDRISVQVVGDTLELRSAEGQLDLEFEPPELGNLIATEITPEVTRLNPAPGPGGGPAPANLALTSGQILIRSGGRGLAAVELFAAPAQLESDVPIPASDAAAVTEQLDLLKAHAITLRINGSFRTLPLVPAAVATLEDAVAFLSRARNLLAGWQGDDWWIGLLDVPGTPGAKRCVIETLRRGSSATLQLGLSAFPAPLPANGILGFTQPSTYAPGTGNVPDIGAVSVTAPMSSLRSLTEQAAERGGARQAIYTASADRTRIRLRGSLAATVLNQTTAMIVAPGGVALADPAGAGAAATIEDTYLGTRPILPGILEIQSDNVNGTDPRVVRTLFHAEPARLGPIVLASDPAVLNRRTLALTVNGTALNVTLSATSTTPAMDLIRQIEAESGWTLRGTIVPGGGAITLETHMRGSAARLALRRASAADAITNDPATGLTAPADTEAEGTGAVGNTALVTGEVFAEALQNAMVSERRQADTSVLNGPRPDANGLFPRINGSAYDPPERDVTDPDLPVHALPREYAQIASQRTGCASSLEPVTFADGPALPAAFDMDRSLERAPALRAALRIPPIGERRLSGRLHIQFNENGGIADLPPEQTFTVDIADADYTAQSLARTIHGQLFDAGIGAAQAYGDGSIMVETLAAGIPGTIRIPANATPDADRPLADLLIPGGGFARGWPGAGRTAPGTRRNAGFRSRVGNLLAAANWVFTDGVAPTAPAAGPPATPQIRNDATAAYTGASGDTLAATAAALDAALANAALPGGGTGRIGFAAIGDDNALYIEGTTATFDMLNTATGTDGQGNFVPHLGVNAPPRIGGTPERMLEPAANLRRTAEPRTLRILRDRFGRGMLAEHDDLGWVRIPAHQATEPPAMFQQMHVGTPAPISQMPPGGYLALARVDAAKTRNYDQGSEMIAHSALHADDSSRALVLQARYWLEWDNSAVMGLRPGPDGLVLLRLVRSIR